MADLHPPPWRWDKYGDLLDAAGDEVAGNPGEGGCGIDVASPYARELIRAAGEMEALLREILVQQESTVLDEDDFTDPPEGVHTSWEYSTTPKVRELLAGIDAAKGANRG